MSDAEKKTQRSSSFDRRVIGYLSPSVAAKFERYVQEKGVGKSEAINDAIRKLVEPMAPQKIVPK
jgi:metal-responsive CopG/Arc/MetJ family transcriptional regulator